MNDKSHAIINQVNKHKEFFNRTISCFSEEDAGFQPRQDMLSVVGHINHVTAGMELMLSGIFKEFKRFQGRQYVSKRPGSNWSEWNMEWTKTSNQDPRQEDRSLSTARKAFNETMDIVQEVFVNLSAEELMKPFSANPMRLVMPWAVLQVGIFDHTAHHRGALSSYARLCGKEPKIPYFEMSEALHEAEIESLS